MGIEIKEFVGHSPKQVHEESEKKAVKNNKKTKVKKEQQSTQKNGD